MARGRAPPGAARCSRASRRCGGNSDTADAARRRCDRMSARSGGASSPSGTDEGTAYTPPAAAAVRWQVGRHATWVSSRCGDLSSRSSGASRAMRPRRRQSRQRSATTGRRVAGMRWRIFEDAPLDVGRIGGGSERWRGGAPRSRGGAESVGGGPLEMVRRCAAKERRTVADAAAVLHARGRWIKPEPVRNSRVTAR